MATSDTIRVALDAPARALTLALGAGFTLSGVVQTHAGDVVGGTRLELVHLPFDAPWIESGRNHDGSPALFDWTFAGQGSVGLVVRRAIADVRGQFQFECVAPGTYVIEADAEGAHSTRSEPIEVRNALTGIVLNLEPAARLHGLVNAIPAGRQPNVRVLAIGGHGLLRTTDIDEEGRYRLNDLEPGEYVVRAYLDDAGGGLEAQVGSIFAVGDGVTATDLVLSAGEDREVDLSLAAFAVGSAAVNVTIDGTPAHGVRVIARFDVDRARGIWRTRRGYTHATGDCILSELPTGSNVITIYDGRTSVPLHRARVEVLPDTVLPIDVRLVTGALRGHLTSRPSGPTLELDGTLTLWPGREGAPDDPTQYGRDHVVQRLRVRGGRFEFAHVPAGPCTARLEVPGKSPLDRVLRILERGLVELEWAIDEERR